jgi:hypothetical protein
VVLAQLRSTSGPLDWTRSLSGDCGSPACFQTNWIAGSVDCDDVLTLIAMLSPCDPPEPVLARSGETAPFQAKSEGVPTVPDCSSEAALGSSSYQRSSAPGPP